MKKIVFTFFIYIHIMYGNSNIENISNAIKKTDCSEFYNYLSTRDKENQTKHFFCNENEAKLKELSKGIIDTTISEKDGELFFVIIKHNDENKYRRIFPLVKESGKLYIKLGLISKEKMTKEKLMTKELNLIEETLVFPLPENIVRNYNKKIELLNRYLEIAKKAEYTMWDISKINSEIKKVKKAKNINKDLLVFVNPYIGKSSSGLDGFFGEVQNKTGETIEELVYVVELLDDDKKSIQEGEFMVFGLKQNHIKPIGKKIYVPSSWKNKRSNINIKIKYISLK